MWIEHAPTRGLYPLDNLKGNSPEGNRPAPGANCRRPECTATPLLPDADPSLLPWERDFYDWLRRCPPPHTTPAGCECWRMETRAVFAIVRIYRSAVRNIAPVPEARRLELMPERLQGLIRYVPALIPAAIRATLTVQLHPGRSTAALCRLSGDCTPRQIQAARCAVARTRAYARGNDHAA